jgi:hypothetical protein
MTPYSVGVLWTRDRRVIEASTWQTHNTHKRKTSMPPETFEPVDPRVWQPGHWNRHCKQHLGYYYNLSPGFESPTQILSSRENFPLWCVWGGGWGVAGAIPACCVKITGSRYQSVNARLTKSVRRNRAHFVGSSSPRIGLIAWESTLRTENTGSRHGRTVNTRREPQVWESDVSWRVLKRRKRTQTSLTLAGHVCQGPSNSHEQGVFSKYPRSSSQLTSHR